MTCSSYSIFWLLFFYFIRFASLSLFSLFINGWLAYKDLVNSTKFGLNGNITIFTASQTSVSYLRLFYDSTQEYIYPHLTAIIDVTNGVVNGITWDDACVFCGNNRCRENTLDFTGHVCEDNMCLERKLINGNITYQNTTVGPTKGCYFKKIECEEIVRRGGSDCDLTLYVAWTGTDSSGRGLFSSTSRFSAFTQKSLQDQFSHGLKKFLDSSFVSTIMG